MSHYRGQNYKINRKTKEAVDSNYIEAKSVYIDVFDERGILLSDIIITINDKEIKTKFGKLVIKNLFENDINITIQKDGYKSISAKIIEDVQQQKILFTLMKNNSEQDSYYINKQEEDSQDILSIILKVNGQQIRTDDFWLKGENIKIDFGDGTVVDYNRNITHEYKNEEEYEVKIYNVTNIMRLRSDVSNINNLIILSNINKLEEYCFSGLKFCNIFLNSKNITNIPKYAFTNLIQCSVVISSPVLEIKDYAFSSTIESSLTIPSSVTNIHSYAFGINGMNFILNWEDTIPEGVINALTKRSSTSMYLIPKNTTDLYVSAGFPRNKLQEKTN